ncbi:MAG: hypothetical protein V3V01_15125, partial [Acidimicrobiales bacterium]
IQMSKWRRKEPGEFSPVHGRLLPQLVETNGGVHSVSAQLGINADHLREVTSWSHLRAVE